MSARSIVRAHEREQERDHRRDRRRARRLSTAAAIAIGTSAAVAPAAGAATFTVNADTDGLTGPCGATCTLRDAVHAANADAAPDTINFAASVTGPIELNSVIPINSAMTIAGPGAGILAVSGDSNFQIFNVDTDAVGAPGEPVTISGLTLENAKTSGNGGAVYSYRSDTHLDADVVRGNHSDFNAAVYVQGGSLTVTNSTFTGNTAGSGGGAIYTDDDAYTTTSDLTIRNSTFRGNSAGISGGAIYVDNGTDSVLISGSTFVGNTAGWEGGAIRFFGPETREATIVDSTITGNVAGRVGGGVSSRGQYDRPVEIFNSTIADNTAGTLGGGVYRYGYSNPLRPEYDSVVVSSSIVAGNHADAAPDLADRVSGAQPITGAFGVGFSLIGDTTGATVTVTGPNVTGADPQLGPLADNGGPTETLLPEASSPVVDAGTANGLTFDQRGLPRTVKSSITPGPSSDGTDIGAVEIQVDMGLEGASVKAKKKQKQKGRKIVIRVDAGAAEAVEVNASGKVKAGKENVKLKPVNKSVQAEEKAKLKLKPKNKKATKAILKTLDAGGKAKASLNVTLTDASGNEITKKPKVTLK